jgi:predicted RNA binding protein YcfA (HicA-like mRNA interferase family)
LILVGFTPILAYYSEGDVANVETNTRKIVGRLTREGWVSIGGAKHDQYAHKDHPEVLVIVPRHREQSIGAARVIAKTAKWI